VREEKECRHSEPAETRIGGALVEELGNNRGYGRGERRRGECQCRVGGAKGRGSSRGLSYGEKTVKDNYKKKEVNL